jgi:hypothetical protein
LLRSDGDDMVCPFNLCAGRWLKISGYPELLRVGCGDGVVENALIATGSQSAP